jgi:cellobiose-specific phosphotransferase system component IIC
MRIFLCLLFLVAGILGLGLLLSGFYPETAARYVPATDAALEALKSPALTALAATLAGASLLFLGYALVSAGSWGLGAPKEGSWAGTFQLAFSASVTLVALFIVGMVLVAGGWVPVQPTDGATLGPVFAIALLQAAVGTLLAVVLLCMSRSNFHYGATLTLHLVESALIGVVFYLGTSA